MLLKDLKRKGSYETTLGDKPVNELLGDISSLCHERLEYSTSKNEECETLYEDNKYEEVYSVMEDRISMLEGTLCNILDLLKD